MKKRIYLKILHEFERNLTDAVYIYLTRPEGEEFYKISIQLVEIGLWMLFCFLAEQKKIIIGKENQVDSITLKEIEYVPKKSIAFEGNAKWIYKKKNRPKEYDQIFRIKFDLTVEKGYPYHIDYKPKT